MSCLTRPRSQQRYRAPKYLPPRNIRSLSKWRESCAGAPKLLEAVEEAITVHGESAEAILSGGEPSISRTDRRSKMVRDCQLVGWSDWTPYCGAKKKGERQGFVLLCVKSAS